MKINKVMDYIEIDKITYVKLLGLQRIITTYFTKNLKISIFKD